MSDTDKVKAFLYFISLPEFASSLNMHHHQD